MRRLMMPRESNVQFQVDGVLFQACYQPDGKGFRLQFWAVLGYLPFSVESFRRRRMLITILDNISSRLNVQFGIDENKQIVISRTFKVPDIRPPEFIFLPLMSFLQEARPFVRLIGECL